MCRAVARASLATVLLAVWAAAQAPQPAWLNHRIEKVAGGLQYIGGMAWSHEGHLFISDGPRGKLHQWTPGTAPVFLSVEVKNPAGLAADERGRVLVCDAGARRVVRVKNGNAIEVLADSFEGKPLNSPNDLAVRKDGLIFFTDPAFGAAADNMGQPFHGLYRLNAKNELAVLARWQTRPNGVALSPDGKTLYVAMSDERTIRAFDLDRQGVATNERILVSGIQGVPNALRVDAKGRLYLAARRLLVYSPEGRPLGQIDLHDRPTALAFAGGKTLYVAARTTVYRIDFEEE
jgi:gluconolactonase